MRPDLLTRDLSGALASPPTDTEAAQPGWLNLAIAGLAILLLGTAALLYVLHRRAPLRRDR